MEPFTPLTAVAAPLPLVIFVHVGNRAWLQIGNAGLVVLQKKIQKGRMGKREGTRFVGPGIDEELAAFAAGDQPIEVLRVES